MKKSTDWSDKEWAEFLGISERKARDYFKEGIIHGAKKDSKGEWRAAGHGINKYLTYQNMARACNWELDEAGVFIDPRLSNELKEGLKPLFDSRKERVLRYSHMMRVASAYKHAVNQEAIEPKKLDAAEEAARWMLSSPNRLEIPKELESYLPESTHIKLIKGLFDQGLMEVAELVVAMVSAINIDGKGISNRLPSAYGEWVKIIGRRPTGKFHVVDECGEYSFRIQTKPNKSGLSRFKELLNKYGREKLIHAAYGLHPNTSDILEQYQDQGCHEGAAHWDIKAQRAMDC